jgi:hypothetical protein
MEFLRSTGWCGWITSKIVSAWSSCGAVDDLRQCLLRTTDRDHSTGVLGLSHPPQRAALAPDSKRIRCFLQSRTPSFRLGPWDTGTNPAECSGERPQASATRRSPNLIKAGPWRIASRLSAGKGGRLTSDGIFADHKYGTRSGRSIGRPRALFQRDRELELRKQGLSWRKIAKTMGVSPLTIRRPCPSPIEGR